MRIGAFLLVLATAVVLAGWLGEVEAVDVARESGAASADPAAPDPVLLDAPPAAPTLAGRPGPFRPATDGWKAAVPLPARERTTLPINVRIRDAESGRLLDVAFASVLTACGRWN